MRVNLTIDRLVLDGLPVEQHDAPAIREAITAELARMLAERRDLGLANAVDVANVKAPTITVPAPASDRLGAQIGAAIGGGLRL